MSMRRERAQSRPCRDRVRGCPGKLRLLTAVLVPAILFLVISVQWDYYYDLNDDWVMADILSGAYTGTPALRNIQSYYPLTVVLGGLGRLSRNIPWYGIFLVALQFGCLALVLHRIQSLSSGLSEAAAFSAAAVLVYLGLLLSHLVFVQYSVTVGIMGAAAAFLFLTMTPQPTVKGWIREILPQLLLIWTAFLLRSEMLLFVSPLIALAFLIRLVDMELPFCGGKGDTPERGADPLLSDTDIAARAVSRDSIGASAADCSPGRVPLHGRDGRTEGIFCSGRPWTVKFRAALITLVLVLAGLAVGYAGNEIGYAREEWQSFYEFFDARTQLYDFEKLPSYEGNEAFYESIGLEEAEADLIINYNFGIDERITADVLQQTADYAQEKANAEQTVRERLANAVWDYRHASDQPYTAIAAVLYLLAAVSVVAALCAGLFVDRASDRKKAAAVSEKVDPGDCSAAGCLCGGNGSDRSMRSGAGGRSGRRSLPHFLLRAAELGILLAGRSALLLYLYYYQRPVERLTHSVYLTEAVILIWIILQEIRRLREIADSAGVRLCGLLISAAATVLFLWAVVVQFSEVQTEYAAREEINQDWTDFLAYCEDHPDDVYFTDVYSMVSFSQKIFAAGPSAVNYDLLGGWMSKSPLERSKLVRLGLAEETGESSTEQIIQTSLLTEDRCYYAAKSASDTEWLVDYYAVMGYEVTVETADTIGDYWTVYTVREKESSGVE